MYLEMTQVFLLGLTVYSFKVVFKIMFIVGVYNGLLNNGNLMI